MLLVLQRGRLIGGREIKNKSVRVSWKHFTHINRPSHTSDYLSRVYLQNVDGDFCGFWSFFCPGPDFKNKPCFSTDRRRRARGRRGHVCEIKRGRPSTGQRLHPNFILRHKTLIKTTVATCERARYLHE